MAYVFPGGSNTYVPSLEATGSLIINFARSPDKFPMTQYVGIKTVTADTGYYVQIKGDEAARIINTDGRDNTWYDGAEAPTGNWNTEAHQFSSYVCKRYIHPFTLGQKAVAQASWDVVAQHAGIVAAKAMTLRTNRMITTLTTSGNWGNNTDTATSVGGGKWNASSTSLLYIKNSVEAVCIKINRATNSVVQPKDLQLVISPTLAKDISVNAEMTDSLKNSYWQLDVIRGNATFQQWGLAPELYGVKLVIEDTVNVTTKKNVTRSDGYALPATVALFLARPDGLVSPNGGPSFNTATLFAYEEFTVEIKDDPDNRRTVGRIVEDVSEVVTAPASGYYLTAVE